MKIFQLFLLFPSKRSLALTALGSLGVACFANAQVLFSDNFSTSANNTDVNFEYMGGRQGGTVGPLQYRQGNGSVFNNSTITGTVADEASNGFQTQINNASAPNALFLAGSNFSLGTISPESNFNSALAAGQYMSISFKLDPVIGGGGTSQDWGAFTLGASNNASYGTSGSGARGQTILTTATNFGVLFRDNGQFQAFDSGNQVGSAAYSASPTTINFHDIEFRVSGVSGSNPFGGGDAFVQVFADGSATPFFTYTKTGGFADNYLTLEGFGSGGGFSLNGFDDFQVSVVAVPEPATWVASCMLVCVGGMSYRRRLNRSAA